MRRDARDKVLSSSLVPDLADPVGDFVEVDHRRVEVICLIHDPKSACSRGDPWRISSQINESMRSALFLILLLFVFLSYAGRSSSGTVPNKDSRDLTGISWILSSSASRMNFRVWYCFRILPGITTLPFLSMITIGAINWIIGWKYIYAIH